MLSNRAAKTFLLTMILVGTLGIAKSAKADILTLFTTPQERQIINANRYKTDEVVESRVEAVQTEFVTPVEQEEINKSFVISGITISNSGPHSVWINNRVYEDGEHLKDNSHIKVLTDGNIRVRITTPDGKSYYGTSGETVEVTYLGTVEN
jgi:hypothetical protein